MKKIGSLLLGISLTLLASCSSINRGYKINVDVCVFSDEVGMFYCPVKDVKIAQDDGKDDYVVISIDDLNDMLEALMMASESK